MLCFIWFKLLFFIKTIRILKQIGAKQNAAERVGAMYVLFYKFNKIDWKNKRQTSRQTHSFDSFELICIFFCSFCLNRMDQEDNRVGTKAGVVLPYGSGFIAKGTEISLSLFPLLSSLSFLHLHEIMEGLYFYFSLSVSMCVCVCTSVCLSVSTLAGEPLDQS